MSHPGISRLERAAWLIVLLVLPAVSRAPAYGTEPPAAVTFLVSDAELSPIRLPAALRRAKDVRWHGEDRVWIAGGKAGTWELDVTRPEAELREVVGVFPSFGPFGSHTRLALTADWIAIGASFRAIFWRNRAHGPEVAPNYNEMSFDFIADLDGFGNQLAILGVRRGRDGAYSPNGIIGWRASLSSEEITYKPFFLSASGPGARNMADCGVMGPGKLRYLKDGSLVFAPGVEPGVFVYAPSGSLVDSWNTEELGIDTDCDLDEKTVAEYYGSFPLRETDWVNQRRVIDEILPLAEGPGIVIRSRKDGLTRWQLRILRLSGEVETQDVPIVSRSGFSHLKGDVRADNALAFLVADMDRDSSDRPIYLFVSKSALPPSSLVD